MRGTGPVELVNGHELAHVESERMRFEVRSGRWVNIATGLVRPCAIIVQQRMSGGVRDGRPFRAVIEVCEVPAIIEGLQAWMRELASSGATWSMGSGTHSGFVDLAGATG